MENTLETYPLLKQMCKYRGCEMMNEKKIDKNFIWKDYALQSIFSQEIKNKILFGWMFSLIIYTCTFKIVQSHYEQWDTIFTSPVSSTLISTIFRPFITSFFKTLCPLLQSMFYLLHYFGANLQFKILYHINMNICI